MAKQLIELERLHATIVPFPIVQCGCKRNCGLIDTNQHAYIYSRATGEYYSDLVCMSNGLGVDVDMMDIRARRRFLEEWEGESIG